MGDEGDRRHYEVEILPILDNASRLAGKLYLFNDTTERRHQEEERQQLEVRALAQSKMATLGQVAAGMAHEIHQPLSYIIAMIQSIQEEAEQNLLDREEILKRLSGSLLQVDRIASIVDHLLVFGRSDETEMHPLHVDAVLENAHMLLGERLRAQKGRRPREFLWKKGRRPRMCAFFPSLTRSASALRITGWASSRSTWVASTIRFSPPRKWARAPGWGYQSPTASLWTTVALLAVHRRLAVGRKC